MNKPTGKLAFAYRTIANLEAERDALKVDVERYQLRLETIRALYPNAPSDVELDIAIGAAIRGDQR